MEANITNKSQASTPRKRQSTAYLGYLNSTQDVKVTFSLTGWLSTHNLCSEKANPRIEIPTKTRDKGRMRPMGCSLPTPALKSYINVILLIQTKGQCLATSENWFNLLYLANDRFIFERSWSSWPPHPPFV